MKKVTTSPYIVIKIVLKNYEYVISFFLDGDYTGGEFIVHLPNGEKDVYVREDAFDKSDYDLILISENPDLVRPEYYKSYALDMAGVLPTEKILKSEQNPIWPCLALFDDSDDLGALLVKRTHNAFVKGPVPLTKEEMENRRNFSQRLIERIQGRGHDPMIRFYYVGDFYQRVLRYWCEINQRWTMSVHRLLPIIATEDPVFCQMFQDLWTDDFHNAALRIHLHLFKEVADGPSTHEPRLHTLSTFVSAA